MWAQGFLWHQGAYGQPGLCSRLPLPPFLLSVDCTQDKSEWETDHQTRRPSLEQVRASRVQMSSAPFPSFTNEVTGSESCLCLRGVRKDAAGLAHLKVRREGSGCPGAWGQFWMGVQLGIAWGELPHWTRGPPLVTCPLPFAFLNSCLFLFSLKPLPTFPT